MISPMRRFALPTLLAVVLVLGEKVAGGTGDDLDRVLDDNADLLGPLRDFLARNKVPRVERVVTALTVDELLEDAENQATIQCPQAAAPMPAA